MAMGLTDTAVQASSDKPSKSQYRTTQLELQSQLMSYADNFSALLVQALSDMDRQRMAAELNVLVRRDVAMAVSSATTTGLVGSLGLDDATAEGQKPTLQDLSTTLQRLNNLIETLNLLLESPVLEQRLDQLFQLLDLTEGKGESFVEHTLGRIFWYGLGLILILLFGGFLVGFGLIRIASRHFTEAIADTPRSPVFP
jgi:hypothetical protein